MAANRGEGQIVVITGEAGAGKTRLASAVAERADKLGMKVMSGGCSEAELTLPFLPFLEAIGNYLGEVELDSFRLRLGAGRHELARLFPQLATDSTHGDGGESVQAKLRLFEAILGLLAVPATAHGLLLVLEDLHWADTSTRELLEYLAHRLRNSRTLVLVTYRSDEIHRKHSLLPLIRGWRRAQVATAIELPALSSAEVAAMVATILDSDEVSGELRDFLYARTEGNPFMLEEMLKAATDRGDLYLGEAGWERKSTAEPGLPTTVKESILLRVHRLAEGQSAILKVAAVLGQTFSYDTLASVSQQEPASIKDAVRAFMLEQLVEEEQGDGHYRFRHALTREAVYDDMMAPERVDLHSRAAEALRQASNSTSVDLANHLFAARRFEDAIPVAIKAAEEAQRLFGHRESADLYERVLPYVRDPLIRGRVICELGVIYQSIDFRAAQRYLEEGLALLEHAGQRREVAHYRLWLGRVHREQGRPNAAAAEYAGVRALLEPDGPSADLAAAYVRLAAQAQFEMRNADAVSLAAEAIRLAEASRADLPRIIAYTYKGTALNALGVVAEGLEYVDRSYHEALANGFRSEAFSALCNSIYARALSLRPREAIQQIPLLQELFDRSAPTVEATHAAFFEGTARLAAGQVGRALEVTARVYPTVLQTNSALWTSRFARRLAQLYAAAGDLEHARRILPADEVNEGDDFFDDALVSIRLALDSGDLAAAVSRSERYLTRESPLQWLGCWVAALGVEAYVKADRLADAEDLVDGIASCRPPEDPLREQAEGRLAYAHHDLGKATSRLSKAAQGFADCGCGLEEAQTRRVLAAVFVAANQKAAAERELRQVVEYADGSGAGFEGQAARHQLAALGIEVPAQSPLLLAAFEPARPIRTTGERFITVMFVDLRGYTRMASRTPPPELVDKIAAFYRWSEQEIARHHGQVVEHAGDAILATFNLRGTRLDHALHALEAAIAIRDKAAAFGLPMGAGLATGPAIVGQFSAKSAPTVLGATVNLAARLQAQAAAGEIMLDEEVYRRVQAWLQQEGRGGRTEELSLKGFERAVTAFRLSASATSPSRPNSS